MQTYPLVVNQFKVKFLHIEILNHIVKHFYLLRSRILMRMSSIFMCVSSILKLNISESYIYRHHESNNIKSYRYRHHESNNIKSYRYRHHESYRYRHHESNNIKSYRYRHHESNNIKSYRYRHHESNNINHTDIGTMNQII